MDTLSCRRYLITHCTMQNDDDYKEVEKEYEWLSEISDFKDDIPF